MDGAQPSCTVADSIPTDSRYAFTDAAGMIWPGPGHS